MVKRHERRLVGRSSQLGIEPAEPLGVELPAVVAGSRAVEHDQSHRAQIDGVLDRRRRVSRELELPPERRAVVVIAGHDVDGNVEVRQQAAQLLVLGGGAVVDQVSGDQDRVDARAQFGYRCERRVKTGDGIAASPCRTDVGVAELGKEERFFHG